ncbi:MAG: ArsR family transcriptional regulator [Mycobacterium sp.]|nr:ArsR family transcriptional regulator [Mycobacterium sp.]
MGTSLAEVPSLLKMASHPLRWALMTKLAGGDCRVRELAAAADEPQNLVSYHLRLLRSARFIDARRSDFDGRDTYYSLNLTRCAGAFGEAASALHPGLNVSSPVRPAARSVLFLCTGNSSRSPMAEALLRKNGQGRIRAASAGSHPKPHIHPTAVQVMRDMYGIRLDESRTRPWEAVSGRRFDHVITLCDKVREFADEHGLTTTAHWSIRDPSVAGGGKRGIYEEFRSVADELNRRIEFLLPVLNASPRDR